MGFVHRALEAACCAQLGQADWARNLAEQCLARSPDATVDQIVIRTPFREAVSRDHLAESPRLAWTPG